MHGIANISERKGHSDAAQCRRSRMELMVDCRVVIDQSLWARFLAACFGFFGDGIVALMSDYRHKRWSCVSPCTVGAYVSYQLGGCACPLQYSQQVLLVWKILTPLVG